MNPTDNIYDHIVQDYLLAWDFDDNDVKPIFTQNDKLLIDKKTNIKLDFGKQRIVC